MTRPIPDRVAALLGERLALLGQRVRLQIVDLLDAHGEMSVQELVDWIGMSQQTVSEHLALLVSGGVLTRRREGRHVFYALADRRLMSVYELVAQTLEATATAGTGAGDGRDR